MFGTLSLVLYDILMSIIIFLTSFLPSNPENLIVDTSTITSQSEYMVFECENKTGRIVDRPTIMKISKKTDEGWECFYEQLGIIEEPSYLYPGETLNLKKSVEYCYGEPTLEPGEYKVKITYRLFEYNKDNEDIEHEYVSVEVPFTVE